MSDDALFDELRTLAAEIFDVPAASLDGASTQATVESWDSLAHLNLLLELESRFGVKFTTSDIGRAMTLDEIAQLVGRKRGGG